MSGRNEVESEFPEFSALGDHNHARRCARNTVSKTEQISLRNLPNVGTLEVEPDPLVIFATIGAADERTVLVHAAAMRAGTLLMHAIAVLALRNGVRLSVVSTDDMLLEVLHREREPQLAAASLAQVDAVLAIHRHQSLRLVFVLGDDEVHLGTLDLLLEITGNLLLALLQLVQAKDALADEKLGKSLQKHAVVVDVLLIGESQHIGEL
jgi:hypothetical protein